MTPSVPRRQFLKTTAFAAGSLVQAAELDSAAWRHRAAQGITIGSVTYRPRDYPIRVLAPWEVALKDTFWAPKVQTNARVTIPRLAGRNDGRGLGGNVLEAAILSLRSHPDAQLQALVDARIASLRTQPPRGNSGFEVAVAYFTATGKRDLLDNAIATADTLYAEFEMKNPPFSGGERDATNCLQLYRATRNRKYLDLAKHYLDIRGLPNSTNRSRHNQSHKPVLEQSEAVGHAVNGVTLMLPSRNELAMMCRQLKATGAGDFRDVGMPDNCQYWTSSQETADMANHIDFADHGRLHYDDKDFPRRVRAIRAF